MSRAMVAQDSRPDSPAASPPWTPPPGRGSEQASSPATLIIDEVVRKRLVFHVGGYEPLTPEAVHRRFTREVKRFETTWSANVSVSPATIDENGARWRVETTGPNWRVETDYNFVRWDDLIEEAARQPMWRRIPRGLLAFLDFVAGGALWGYMRTNWRYAGFFLYPFVLLAAFTALATYVGVIIRQATELPFVGIAAGALIFVALLRWPGRRMYLPLMLDDWIFARAYVRSGDAVLAARLDAAAGKIVDGACVRAGDEIVIVGHSLGAVLAVDLVDRALRNDSADAQKGLAINLLTVGSSIPKIGLHRSARPFRAALARVAAAPGVFWAEYQALLDVMNFYKTDPVAALGLPPTGRPVVRIVRISRMLDPAFYRRIKRNFFRLHRQFISGNDRRATYDYFMLLCGPLSTERQVRSPDGAVSAIGPDGALLHAKADVGRSGDAPTQQGNL